MDATPSTAGAPESPRAAKARPPEDEQRLIERVRRGENEVFYELIRPYERSLYLAAFTLVRNEHDAEDVVQEAVLKAYAHLATFRGDARFSTWLIQITINEARLRLRRERRPLYDSIDEGERDDAGEYYPRDYADWREIPSEALARRELRDALRQAIDSLPPIYREVFVLRDVQHLSIAETAEILGVPEPTVKTRLLRARLQMRDALAPGYDGSWSAGERLWKKVRPW